MKKFLVLGLILCSGCAQKFDPKVDPDIAKIVDAVNEDRANIREMSIGLNIMLDEFEHRFPGIVKAMTKRLEEFKKKHEVKS